MKIILFVTGGPMKGKIREMEVFLIMLLRKNILYIVISLILSINFLPVYGETAEEWANKGWGAYKEGDYTKSIIFFNIALDINPKYPEALNGKGWALYGQDKYDEAIECFDKALKISPKYSNALNGKGWSLYSQDKYGKAIECFDKALEISPKYSNALDGKGWALYKQGKYNEAIQCFNQCLNINSNYDDARKGKKKSQAALNGTKTEMTLKSEDLKKLKININNSCYTGEKILQNGVLYIILSDFKNFANSNYINFDYKRDGNKLVLTDNVSEYEYNEPFIKEGYDIYVSLENLCTYLKFSYDYNPDKYLLTINKSLGEINSVNKYSSVNKEETLILGQIKIENSYIVGEVTNVSNKILKTVFIKFNLYDENGKQVGDTIDSCNNLEPNKIWIFKAPIIETGVYNYKLLELLHYD